MRLGTPLSAIMSAVIFNALIIPLLVPLALRGVRYRPVGAQRPPAPQRVAVRVRRHHRAVHRHQAGRPRRPQSPGRLTVTTRGTLRVYLGMAPGVGKTYAMLGEGQPRGPSAARDVVVAFVENHGRRRPRRCSHGLEVVPRRTITYRGAAFTEMDLDAVLARRPQVALVDELAHTNVPGSPQRQALAGRRGAARRRHRRDHHRQHPAPGVAQRRGRAHHRRRQRETVPDEVVRRADQIELVDMTPEALRRRMAHGNIYPPDKVDAALSNYFRAGNLTALRELALLWVADRVDEGLQRYRAEHGITATWEARERIVVALTGGPEGDTLHPPGRPDRRPGSGARPARRPRRPQRRAHRRRPGRARPPAHPGRGPRRHLPPRRRRRRRRTRCWTSPAP